MIEAEHLTKYYPPPFRGFFDLGSLRDFLGKPREEIPALIDLSFRVREGEIFGLLGPNGAGKTTLCKIANGLLEPSSGKLLIDGHDSFREHGKVAGEMFTVFTGERDMWGIFQWRLSVQRNLQFIARLWKVPEGEIGERIEYALKLLNLWEKRDEWYQKLSAGMKQKVYIASALVVRPKYLILDEPTVFLDVITKSEIHDAIMALVRDFGTTVILTTHDLQEAEKLSDRVLLFNKRPILEGKPEEISRKLEVDFDRKVLLVVEGSAPCPGGYLVRCIRKGNFTHVTAYLKSGEVNEFLSRFPSGKVLSARVENLSLEDVFMILFGS
ncbi:ABC transporter ATP-binding protein [Thermococcus sp. MV11]|uniref:ABC transporter ATP-binding protein n=1 Tax=Thermococcus sp. MV11 TaxID=1638267 RepID=UPI0014314FE4|nr:ABC transporter ATP-binding protein [Thermococcus sp. MV11]NJE04144.1 ABC transporter ATP-binding protein [Thermococcus sp. MV11]